MKNTDTETTVGQTEAQTNAPAQDPAAEGAAPEKKTLLTRKNIILAAKILWTLAFAVLMFALIRRGYFVKKSGAIKPKRVLYGAILTIGGAVLLFVRLHFSEKVEKALSLIITILSPVFTYLILEIHLKSNYKTWAPKVTVGNLMLLYALLCIGLFLTNYYLPTVLLPAAWWTFFAVTNLHIMESRGAMAVVSDLTLLRSALQVAGEFKFVPSNHTILMVLVTFDYVLFLCKFKNIKYFEKLSHRGIFALATILFSVFACDQVMNHDYVDMRKTQYLPQRAYKQFGAALTFISSTKILFPDKPEGYSPQVASDLAKKYPTDSVDGFDVTKAPSIIVIMDEAFSDFTDTYGMQTSEPIIPYFRSLNENAINGHMYVSIHGGQTANTEYEFLTGNSKAFIPSGISPFQSYMKTYGSHMSLMRNLRMMGYEDLIAYHSYNTVGYNRVQAYQNLGFSHFYSEDSTENPTYMRDYIDDESDFNKVIQLYENSRKQTGKPCFIFNVTMQNHSPYDSYYDNMDCPISISDEKYNTTEYVVYNNLMKHTDTAYEHLIEYFKEQEDPVIVVMFGDHQPAMVPDDPKDHPLYKYEVPFKIWANYDIPEDTYDVISPGYLGTIVMDLIGAPLTGYQKFLLDARKEIPAITFYGYIGSDGKLYDTEDTSSPYYETMKAYHYLQYNSLFDKDNIMTDFFYLKGADEKPEGYGVD